MDHARRDLLNGEMEIARLTHQMRAKRRMLSRAEVEEEYNVQPAAMSAEPPDRRSLLSKKHKAFHVVALIGMPLLMALFLTLELHKVPNSSVSYSLLNAVISLLFNFSSSALFEVSSVLMSLLGLSKWFAPSERLQ